MKNRVRQAIIIISLGGMLSSFWLIAMNMRTSGFCPPLFDIPACYFVLLAFTLVFISTLLRKEPISSILFYPGSFLGLTLAIWFSYNRMTGKATCPSLFDFPLCYLSFFVFIALLMLHASLKKGEHDY